MEYDYRYIIFKNIVLALLDEDLLNLNGVSADDVVGRCVDIIDEKLSDFVLLEGEVY